jgi:GMP synthase-like glutamine amidotransferase
MVCGRALGLQFHPEATESIVRTWASGEGESELVAIGLSETELLEHTRAYLTDAAHRCDEIVDWFLANIAQRHMG